MSRTLPTSDISYPASVYGGGPPYWSLVNKLVPDNCPGASSLTNNIAGAAGTTIEFGLPTLSQIPATCAVKIYASAPGGVNATFYVKESGTVIFQSASAIALPSSSAELDVAMPNVAAPSGTTGWTVAVQITADASGSQFWVYGVEVDFGSGGNGAGGQNGINGSFFLAMMQQRRRRLTGGA